MRPSCCLAFLHHQSATPICQRARAIGRLHQTMQRIFIVPGKIRPLEADRHLRSLESFCLSYAALAATAASGASP